VSDINHGPQEPNIGNTAAGTLVTISQQSATMPRNFQRVNITGFAPASGHTWMHDLDSGEVEQMPNTVSVEAATNLGVTPKVALLNESGMSGLAGLFTPATLSAIPDGGFFSNSGALARKPVVVGAAPTSGNAFVLDVATGVITEQLVSNTYVRVLGTPRTWKP
jgi:hypothetical protein